MLVCGPISLCATITHSDNLSAEGRSSHPILHELHHAEQAPVQGQGCSRCRLRYRHSLHVSLTELYIASSQRILTCAGSLPRLAPSTLLVSTCRPSSSRRARLSRPTVSLTRLPSSRVRWRRLSCLSPRWTLSSLSGWATSCSTNPCSTPSSTLATPTSRRTVSSSPTRPPFSLPVLRTATTKRRRLDVSFVLPLRSSTR